MCYVLLLSTTSAENLAQRNSEYIRFSAELPDIADRQNLQFPYQWYVGSKAGCSCTFRHLHSVELGFGAPVDWYPEDDDEIAATLALIRIIREIVKSGNQVDCIDIWEHQALSPAAETVKYVDLSAVSDKAFRLFENYQFRFEGQSARHK